MTVTTDAYEYTGTGVATSDPPPAWLELVLRARAQMHRHRAPRRAQPAQSERGEGGGGSVSRSPGRHEARGESIHLAPAEPSARKDRSATVRPHLDRIPDRSAPDARAHDVPRPHTGARDDGSRIRLTSAAHPRAGQQQPQRRMLSPAGRDPEQPSRPDAESSPAAHQRLGGANTFSERHTARTESPEPAPPDYISRQAPQRRPQLIPPTSSTRAEPESAQASNATSSHVDTVDDAHRPEPLRHARATPADARTTRSPSRSAGFGHPLRLAGGFEPSPVDARATTHAQPEWPELPDDDDELPDAQLLLREWNRLRRIRAEHRGQTWNA